MKLVWTLLASYRDRLRTRNARCRSAGEDRCPWFPRY